MRSYCILPGFLKTLKPLLRTWMLWGCSDCPSGLWLKPVEELKRGFSRDRVCPLIVREFELRQQFGPVLRIISTVESKCYIEFLIDSFR